jgi:ribosomal protein S18 acetylase RimI-like enzyme
MILETLAASFAGWHGDRSEAFWNWKFERNPHGTAYVWVAEEGNRIAGCYVWNAVAMRAGATRLHGAQSVDAAVHPDFRGSGLFTRLAAAAVADAPALGLDLVYAFPTPAAWRGQLKVGFTEQFRLPRTYRMLGLSRDVLAVPLSWRRRQQFEVRREEEFGPEFDAFTEPADSSLIAVQRDHRYLRWRYVEHPTEHYEALRCDRDGALLGYVVSKSTGRRGEIVDLQVAPSEHAAAKALVRCAVARLRRAGVVVAASFRRPPGAEERALRAHGFTPAYATLRKQLTRGDYGPGFITLDLHPDQAQLAGRPWSLVPSDADYV